jgi:alkylation response protein AidB-like acyl-CoA dehydrogenase
MTNYFSQEHQIFRESLRAFLEKEVRPYIEQWEEDGELPRSIYHKFGQQGYFGLHFPEEYGGMGLDTWYGVIYSEELTRMNSGGFQASIGAHPGLALTHIEAEGTELLKQEYLVPGIRGERIGCLAITEPGGGSDVQAIETTAVRDGDHFIVNGSKTFITNGVNSDFIVAAVKTSREQGAHGISMLVIDRDIPGVSANKLDKLGWRSSDTGEISFQDVRVPVDRLLGEENQGFFYIMQHFVSERLAMALIGVSTSQYALEQAVHYMHQREAFGRPLKKFQVLRHRMAQLASEIEMLRCFIYSLYDRYGKGEYLVKEASMAKLLGTQLNDKAATECLQVFGGYGYMEEYPMARLFRDARLGQIGGGTSEIMCEIIAKMIIDQEGYSSAL